MARKKIDFQAYERRLQAARAFNDTDPEKANQLKDEVVMALLREIGLRGLALSYDSVVKLYESQSR